MSTASKESLEDLHAQVADKLSEAIRTAEPDAKGLAAILNVARQMLKDNNIEAIDAPGSHLARLKGEVAQFPFDPNTDSAHGIN